MGYYIEVPENQNKAQQMIELYGAQRVEAKWPPPPEKTLLCVVVNIDLGFDAIGIVYDKREFEAFNDPDDLRPKTWLLIDTKKAIELCPRAESVLSGRRYRNAD